MTEQIKSKERVAEHGEVFTAQREVDAMCDLVKPETERIDSRFLEPACGDGNFLATILKRKLAIVKKNYRRSAYDWERYSLLALGSLYGVDILLDNAVACRKRLYAIWNEEYQKICKKECNNETRMSAWFILDRNIVCGNALTLMRVDKDGEDTPEPIVFSEWTFPVNDARMKRKDYTLAELMAAEEPPKQEIQMSLFDPAEPDEEGIFLQEYISHYRRICENDPVWMETYIKKEEEKNND